MIKANKANEIVTEAINREVKERKTAAEFLCNTKISIAIEEAANRKECSVMIHDIARNIRAYVIAYVKSNGYKVELADETTIKILW